MNKTCTKCKQSKDLGRFQPNAKYRDGFHGWCKDCKLDSQRKNPGANKRWVAENKEAVKASKQRYVDSNLETVRESKRKWSKANSKAVLAKTRAYQAAKLQATPPWLTDEQYKEMENIYKNCPKGYHVDHKVPLRGKQVRGLHVPWNLRYLPADENFKKSNKLK